MEIRNSQWITVSRPDRDLAPVFRRVFSAARPVESAELQLTSLGVYEAELNGQRVGDFVLAPGWTSYATRLQVQSYDITPLLQGENELRVTVGRGWFRSPMPGWDSLGIREKRFAQPCGLIALLILRFADGSEERIVSDESWQWAEGPIRFSEIYDGETADARITPENWEPVLPLDWSRDCLIPQEGEPIREAERIAARRVFKTPDGDTVVDFGQEITGWVEFTLEAKAGEEVLFDHAEVLGPDGSWYNENYRSAKSRVRYVCRDGRQTWHPRLTFFGFRMIRLISWPGEASPEQFTAVAVHSDLRRTGWLKSGDPLLNRFFSNVVWGQLGNFLDVPTDCPQRDERLGWTGDAEAFVRAAACFYDVERFFRKWLRDLRADQRPDGGVGSVIPDVVPGDQPAAAWGDAAAIVPWEIYQAYGCLDLLADQFDSMVRWVRAIPGYTKTPDLWTDWPQFADWLGLDAPEGSYKGASRENYCASAFYANSLDLAVRTGRLLGRDVSDLETQHARTVAAFRRAFPTYETQTEYVLAIEFGLAEDPQQATDALADMIRKDGTRLRTGFMGTPRLLHVLSRYGYSSLAWDLLLRREYPGWLYPVTRGATTVWEHWDGIREDGSFWSKDMNSFNHYAYGAVADWVFSRAAGLRHAEDRPGYAELIYAPEPDARIGWLQARLDTRFGPVSAFWSYEEGGIRYDLETPVPALIRLGGEERRVTPGRYTFWTEDGRKDR